MNNKNIDRLVRRLRRIPKRGFDMKRVVFVGHRLRDLPISEALPEAHRNRYQCGTTACVAGHLASMLADMDALLWNGLVAYLSSRLGLCRQHAFRLGSPNAKHQTPREAAKYLEQLQLQQPPCCDGPDEAASK